jgi:hypothetical protein
MTNGSAENDRDVVLRDGSLGTGASDDNILSELAEKVEEQRQTWDERGHVLQSDNWY